MSKLNDIFDLPAASATSELETLPESPNPAGIAEIGIEESEGKIDILIDAKKASKLNAFVQQRLVKLYDLATSAADTLVLDIQSGDTDARSIEGTARLIESGVKALTELNKYNMFLQQQIYDVKIKEELNKLHAELRKESIRSTREGVIRAIRDDENENG